MREHIQEMHGITSPSLISETKSSIHWLRLQAPQAYRLGRSRSRQGVQKSSQTTEGREEQYLCPFEQSWNALHRNLRVLAVRMRRGILHERSKSIQCTTQPLNRRCMRVPCIPRGDPPKHPQTLVLADPPSEHEQTLISGSHHCDGSRDTRKYCSLHRALQINIWCRFQLCHIEENK